MIRHWQAAETYYQQSLDLRPASDIAGRGPTCNQLGTLYAEVGQTERAREHFEKDVQICE